MFKLQLCFRHVSLFLYQSTTTLISNYDKGYLSKYPQVRDFYYGIDETVRVDLVSIYLKAGEYTKAIETFTKINLYQDIVVQALEQEGKMKLPLFQMSYRDVLSQAIESLIFIDLDKERKKEILKSSK